MSVSTSNAADRITRLREQIVKQKAICDQNNLKIREQAAMIQKVCATRVAIPTKDGELSVKNATVKLQIEQLDSQFSTDIKKEFLAHIRGGGLTLSNYRAINKNIIQPTIEKLRDTCNIL